MYDVGLQAEFGFNFSVNVDVPESNQPDFRSTDKAEDFYWRHMLTYSKGISQKSDGSNLQSKTGNTVCLFVCFFSSRNPLFADLKKRFHPAPKPMMGLLLIRTWISAVALMFFSKTLTPGFFLFLFSSVRIIFWSFWELELLAVDLWMTVWIFFFLPRGGYVFTATATRRSLPHFFFLSRFLASLFLAHTFALLYCVWNM